MNRSHSGPGRHYLRRDERMQPHTKDSYRDPKRPSGDRICEGCGAVCDAGRWTWYATPLDRRQLECPACKRMRENAPAGELVLRGEYVRRHRSAILELLERQADLEMSEHALERIMEIEQTGDALVIRTTGVHVVRRMRITARWHSTIATARTCRARTGPVTRPERSRVRRTASTS